MLGRTEFKVLIALLACLFFYGGNALAENRVGSLTMTPFISAHVFEGNEGVDNAAEFGLSLGYNFTEKWAGELTTSFMDVEEVAPGTTEFNVISARFDVLYHFQPEEKIVPYFAAGLGGVSIGDDPNVTSHDNEDFTLNYGFGFKFFATDWLALRTDIRHLLRFDISDGATKYNDKFYNNLLLTAGLAFQVGGGNPAMKVADADDDGVLDSLDNCPDTPPGYRVDDSGCPIDSDGDGVVDPEDLCAGTAPGLEVDGNGCEIVVVVPVVDSDGDGIVDTDDKCPNTPAGIPVNSYGCPADSDGDTVFDVDDDCPNTPPGTAVGPDGCGPDDVNIKIRSEDDSSRAEAFRSEHPEGAELAALAEKESLELGIQFAPNRSTIDPRYDADMKQAAAFMAAHPGAKVVVEGHTDSTGSSELNRKLSQKRADTVRWILVRDYGVDPKHITAKGFGESQPIADNTTQSGRAKNRRVLLKVVNE